MPERLHNISVIDTDAEIAALETQFNSQNPEVLASVDALFESNLKTIEETTTPEARQEAARAFSTKGPESGDQMHRNHRWGAA